jgi:hypothetical protein
LRTSDSGFSNNVPKISTSLFMPKHPYPNLYINNYIMRPGDQGGDQGTQGDGPSVLFLAIFFQ